MTELLLALILAALLVLIVVLVRRRSAAKGRTGQEEKEAASAPRDPFADVGTGGDPRELKAGDMVDYLGRRYFVRGSLRLTEGGYRWSEHFLDDVEGTKRWISVEEDPELEIVLWTEYAGSADDGGHTLIPDRAAVTIDGVDYRRTEHGTATYRSEGTTGLGDSGPVEYADYEGSQGRYLSFERFSGGQWEAGLGEKVPTGSLTIYPAS